MVNAPLRLLRCVASAFPSQVVVAKPVPNVYFDSKENLSCKFQPFPLE